MYRIVMNEVDAQIAEISHYPWSCSYQPQVYFYFWYEKNLGFHLSMTCKESQPKSIYRCHNDPVYKDSCLEFFVDFFPSDKEFGYLNFEMNAYGAMLLQYGKNKHDRISVVDCLPIKHAVTFSKSSWTINLFIPLSFIEEIYGQSYFDVGSLIAANAYKCGDDTAIAHYGCWHKVVSEQPNFHRPDDFGMMTIDV